MKAFLTLQIETLLQGSLVRLAAMRHDGPSAQERGRADVEACGSTARERLAFALATLGAAEPVKLAALADHIDGHFPAEVDVRAMSAEEADALGLLWLVFAAATWRGGHHARGIERLEGALSAAASTWLASAIHAELGRAQLAIDAASAFGTGPKVDALERARAHFRSAVAADPANHEAATGLADACEALASEEATLPIRRRRALLVEAIAVLTGTTEDDRVAKLRVTESALASLPWWTRLFG